MSEQQALDFKSILNRIEGSYKGSVDELDILVDEAFIETVKRVLGTGKVGKLTVTLAFNRIDDTRIEVKGDVSTKLPEPKTDTKTIYHDSRGNLFVEDPKQQKLPFPTPLKQVKPNQEAV
ncbi:MAG: hypothetical protein PHF29_08010 [Candidatus Riflebacteria bacterium]|nr:hypothetical protein [Candidatus Riflebacteria bacterium]